MTCQGATSNNLIFSCSGAADVGLLADRAARQVSKGTTAKMYCLNGLGGKVEAIIQKTASADGVVAIDGCGVNCAKKTLDVAGITGFAHLLITDMGFIKGSTEVTDEAISTVATAAEKIFTKHERNTL